MAGCWLTMPRWRQRQEDSPRVLAYVFWHRPYAEVSRSDYEAALAAFHEQLHRASCPGLEGSAAYRIFGAPWQGGGDGYEDWYVVASSWALDPLNSTAVVPNGAGNTFICL